MNKDGQPMNVPEGIWDHLLTAARYLLTFIRKEETAGGEVEFVGLSANEEGEPETEPETTTPQEEPQPQSGGEVEIIGGDD